MAPHPRTTPEEVRAIRADPRSHYEIAADYGIDRSYVGKIKRNHKRKEVV